MMKRKFYLMLCMTMLAIAGATLFAGCSKDKGIDEPEQPKIVTLELSEYELVFESGGGEKVLTISCNGNWTIENGSGWCKTDVSSGTGNLNVTVKADEYSGMEDRNVNLTVKAGDKTQVLGVTQKYKDAIVLSKDKFEVPQEGQTISVEVKSNISYEVTVPEEYRGWIAPAPESRAVTTKSYDFAVSETDSADSRTGFIVFSGNSLKDTVWVYQAQRDRLILTEDTCEVFSEGGEITVELKTNIDYDIDIPSSAASWIERVETRALRTDKISFSVSQNGNRDARSAAIRIKDRNSSLFDILYINQEGWGFILSERDYPVPVDGDTLSIKLKSGMEYDVTIPAAFRDWIVLLGADSTDTYGFAVLENEASEIRKGYILFSNGSQTDTAYVTQYYLNEDWLEMVYVEGGTFQMGATLEQDSSDLDSDEYLVHSVTLSDYYIGKTEVTQGLWKAVMGSNPSYFKKGDDYPVENVSWNDIQDFLTKLNQMTGKKYALPTEAQWEYAARGGNNSAGYKYSGSNDIDNVAWYYYNSGASTDSGTTHPVGTKQANELGIYDMSGNVWEWCQDWYDSYSSSSQTDPTGPSSGSDRVLRGGSWNYYANCCWVSFRYHDTPNYRDDYYGFRVVLIP